MDYDGRTVIIADGSFPQNEIPLRILRNASRIICCDGATESLLDAGYVPDAIVGDLDSLQEATAERFSDRLYRETEQETNDLTKAVYWCSSRRINNIVLLGATGKREDHTLGNISLLAEYVRFVDVIMVTDSGIFSPHTCSFTAGTFPGQQISIFSVNSETIISSSGLKYVLDRKKMTNWWVATLNEAESDKFSLEFTGGPVIIFKKFLG